MIKFGLKPAMTMSLADSDNPVEQLNTIIDFAKAARDAGFHSIWAGQHYFGGNRIRWEVIPLLARLIPEVKDSVVGTCILLLPLHHPVLMAEQAAILDIMSGGKLVFGVGLGYREQEFSGFGVLKRDRATRFEEALVIIKDLWANGKVDFAGKHYKFTNLTTPTLPLQKPTPPIWIAAHGDKAVQRAVRLGDSVVMNPHASIDTLARQLEIYRDALKHQLKPFPAELSIRKDIYIAENREKAWDEAEREVPKLMQRLNAEKQYQELPADDGYDETQDLKTFIRSRFIVGDPSDCIAQIQTHRNRLSLNHFIFRIACPEGNRQVMMEKIKLIGREIIGHFEDEV
jgi:alkanesulfonate monooxygenase SsuD/methylene tetrahydromethanopterin reductase-like flavin-dependent oxidoreductase (luciferase family)